MSTIKNGEISLYCHFSKIKKGSGTNLQFPALNKKHVKNVTPLVFDQFHFDVT